MRVMLHAVLPTVLFEARTIISKWFSTFQPINHSGYEYTAVIAFCKMCTGLERWCNAEPYLRFELAMGRFMFLYGSPSLVSTND
jgi:hypothetical protein